MRFLLAPLLLSLVTVSGAQSSAAPAPASASPAPTAGSQTAAPQPSAPLAVYQNSDLHLAYSYPSNYTDATAMVGPALQASLSGDPASAAAARCISLPFSRMETGTGQVGILLLIRADAGCMKKKFNSKTLVEFTEGEAQGLTASGAKTTFGPPVNFQIASRPATLLQGSFTLPTGQTTMQAMVVCVLDQPDVACWQFLAGSAAHLRTMSSYPVSFAGAAPTPLVPPNLLPRP